jgi:hypothetical protein
LLIIYCICPQLYISPLLFQIFIFIGITTSGIRKQLLVYEYTWIWETIPWFLVRSVIICSCLCCVFFLFVFVFVMCLVYQILPVSLDCQFLITPSVFSNVYYLITPLISPSVYHCHKQDICIWHKVHCFLSKVYWWRLPGPDPQNYRVPMWRRGGVISLKGEGG